MPQRNKGVAFACLVGLAGLMACAPGAPAPLDPPQWLPPPTVVTRVSRPVVVTPTVLSTREPSPTAQTIDAAVALLQRALQASDPAGLQPLLGDEVLLDNALITRDLAWQWLVDHWGPAGTSRRIVATAYTEHFVLLEVETAGWAPVPPLHAGTIEFHLHRYDAAGRGDPLDGEWRIDAIFYE
jgi:hypothetical protein